MWQRLTLSDVRVIGHYLGVLVLVAAIGLAAPLLTAIVFGEWHAAARYLLTAGIFLIAGSGLRFMRVQPGRLSRQQALAITGLAWLVLAFFAAIPLHLSGHYASYLDALFEAVSGLTTTGASVVQDLDHLSYADNMWRFMMHLMGGLGLVVVALSFGLFGKGGGASLFSSEGRSEHVLPNVMQTTRFIGKLTLFFIAFATTVVTIMCIAIGLEPARAFLQSLWVSISAFTTAGFVPMSQNILYYHSLAIEASLVVVMLLGSINFTLHSEVIRGNIRAFFEDTEVRVTAVWLVAIVVVFAASLAGSRLMSDLPAMERRGLFMVVAAFTTTGFQNITTSQLTGSFASGMLIIAILMAVGGCAGSTAGGIKINRLALLGKSIVATLKETLAPDTARVTISYQHIGRRLVSPEIVREATTILILYGTTYIVGALVGIASGYDASQAIFESVAMASNGGITSGIVVPGMAWHLELFYLLEMWAGRLEFVTLLALLIQIVVSATPDSLASRMHARRARRRRS